MSREKSELSKIFHKHPKLQGFRNRMIQLVETEYGDNWAKFSRHCGISDKILNSLKNGKNAIDAANIIVLMEWNSSKAIWLLTGARPLQNGSTEGLGMTAHSRLENLEDRMKALDNLPSRVQDMLKEIGELKVAVELLGERKLSQSAEKRQEDERLEE